MSILVIPIIGDIESVPFTDTGLNEIYAALGSKEIDKTIVDRSDDWGVYAWVGDDSLSDDSPINARATDARNERRAELGHGPHPQPLCGTVVLMAFDARSGETVDLPATWRRRLERFSELENAGPTICCPVLQDMLLHACDQHGQDCPDVVVRQLEDQTFIIPISDGGSSGITINFCPWCGASLVGTHQAGGGV